MLERHGVKNLLDRFYPYSYHGRSIDNTSDLITYMDSVNLVTTDERLGRGKKGSDNEESGGNIDERERDQNERTPG